MRTNSKGRGGRDQLDHVLARLAEVEDLAAFVRRNRAAGVSWQNLARMTGRAETTLRAAFPDKRRGEG